LELFPAYIVHAVPGRARIKIPGKRGDGPFFAALEASLQACPAVRAVQVNDRAASVLITHLPQSPLKAIADYARQHRLFGLDGEQALPLPSPVEIFADGLKRTDRLLKQADQLIAAGSGGRLDTQSVFFLLFLGLALRRAWRSHLLEPDMPLLWRVVELLKGL
jgi:hypothetical protein